MAHPRTSHKKAKAFSLALFLVGLALLTYIKEWWPGIMLVVGLPLALRQYLMGRTYDMIISLIVFVGVFLTVQLRTTWEFVLPVLFILGALYISFREFAESSTPTEEETDEDTNIEIEEDQTKNKK